MDGIIVANPVSVFNLFGWGFLLGSLFAFVMMLAAQAVVKVKSR